MSHSCYLAASPLSERRETATSTSTKESNSGKGLESLPPSFPHISAGPGCGPLITQPRGSMLMMLIITAAVGERNGRSILKGSHGNPLRPLYCKSPGLLEQWLTEQHRCNTGLWSGESLRDLNSSIIWTIRKNIRKRNT